MVMAIISRASKLGLDSPPQEEDDGAEDSGQPCDAAEPLAALAAVPTPCRAAGVVAYILQRHRLTCNWRRLHRISEAELFGPAVVAIAKAIPNAPPDHDLDELADVSASLRQVAEHPEHKSAAAPPVAVAAAGEVEPMVQVADAGGDKR